MDAHSESAADHSEDRKKLWELINDIRFAMFTTRRGNGHLHSRPMTTQSGRVDDDSSLWFFMSRQSDAVVDIQDEPNVAVIYADPGSDNYVSVAGEAKVVTDMAIKEQLWNKMTEAFFPKGVHDPDLSLVQVSITHADYWEATDGKLIQLFKIAKASITGKPPTDMGERGHVDMQ